MPTPVEEIKSRLDIVDLIQEYFPLKQSGANFKALCPFHTEKTPSFMVSREKQFFKCFGCGESGDIFTFLQKMENIEFPEALRILADKAGVKLRTQAYDPQFQNLKTRLYDLHKAAMDFYHQQLLNSKLARQAREYLINQRGLNKDVIEEFQIGYAPDSWDAVSKFLKSKGFSDNEIRQSGLVVEKGSIGPDGRNYYDRFRDRIMFPICDHHGNVIGFSGRAMKSDDTAKYINTPQTAIYNKSRTLYGLYKAKNAIRENDLVILVEGNMDVIASHRSGVKNAVACSGTSLTTDQIRILKRYTNNLAMCFDADAAGIAAGERGIEMAWQNGMSVKVIILPSGIKDPDELIRKSAAAWQEAVNKRVNFMDYFLTINLSGQNLDDLEVKRKVSQKVLPWIAKLGDPIEKGHYLKELSNKLNVSENDLRESLAKIKTKKPQSGDWSQYKNVSGGNLEPVTAPTQQINKNKTVSERLMALVLSHPEFIKELVDNLAPEMLDQSLQLFYKEAIFYYTKSGGQNMDVSGFYQYLKTEKKDLAFVFDTLQLLAEKEFTQLGQADLNREFGLSINFLKKENISQRLKQIEQQIKLAEQSNDFQKAEELMKEFSELSKELAGL